MEFESEINRFYDNKSVLLTGATGFVGKAILEKLLGSCPQVRDVYVLLRPKSGSDIAPRLRELLEDPIFNSIRNISPDAFSKVIAVRGDIAHPQLGMDETDRANLVENIGVIIHSAAHIKLNEDLKTILNLNVCGVSRVLDLGREAKKLKAFVYVSTAFANCDRPEIEEVIYPASFDADRLIQSLEWMDDGMISAITPHVLQRKPNTYTFSKALAESVVGEACKTLPVCIVRPSVVTGAFEAPTPGWIYGAQGAAGVIMSVGAGLNRNMLSRPNLVLDYIPVDFVANCVVAASCYTTKQSPGTIKVYNCCSGSTNPFYWGQFRELVLKNSRRHALSKALMYPNLSFTSNVWLYKARMFFFNYVPAYLVDRILLLFGQRPQFVRAHKKIQELNGLYEYFTIREWKFPSDNVVRLQEEMAPVDKAKFNLDLRRIKWEPYFESMWLGLRKYVAKDLNPSSTTSQRLMRLKFMGRVPMLTMLLLVPAGASWVNSNEENGPKR